MSTTISTVSHIFFLFLSSSLLFPPPLAADRRRHVITLRPPPGLRPSALWWDPTAQHFLVGSRQLPTISSLSDAGVFETLVHDSDLPLGSSLPSLALDHHRRRLLVVVAGGAAGHIAAYDLLSLRPHRRIFLSTLPSSSDPADVAVDPTTGFAYVTSSSQNLIWKVDLDGEASIFSRSEIYDGNGLAGIAHVGGKGYLLAVRGSDGRVYKVDEEDGTARTVLIANAGAAAEADGGVAVMSDGSGVVAGGGAVRILKSDDGWAEAAVYDEVVLAGGGEGKALGVAVREGRRVYVLFGVKREGSLGKEEKEEEGGEDYSDDYVVEEVEWGREKEGEWVVGLVLLGLGLAYFLYWRFQMGQLASNMNKKRV